MIPVELAVEKMKAAALKSYGAKGQDVVDKNYAAICAVLVGFSVRAFAFSKLVFRYSLSRQTPAETLRDELLRFSSRFISALIITCAAAMLDTLLWTLFAATFQF